MSGIGCWMLANPRMYHIPRMLIPYLLLSHVCLTDCPLFAHIHTHMGDDSISFDHNMLYILGLDDPCFHCSYVHVVVDISVGIGIIHLFAALCSA